MKTRISKLLALLLAVCLIAMALPMTLGVSADTAETAISFDHAGSQDNMTRYLVHLNNEAGNVPTGGGSFSALIDGVQKTVDFAPVSGKYTLVLGYSLFETDITSAGQMGQHLLTIPAGTVIGGITTTNTLELFVSGWNITVFTGHKVNIVPGTLNYQGNFDRYLLRYSLIDADNDTTTYTSATQYATAYINGNKAVGSANANISWNDINALTVNSNAFGLDTMSALPATSFEIKPYTFLNAKDSTKLCIVNSMFLKMQGTSAPTVAASGKLSLGAYAISNSNNRLNIDVSAEGFTATSSPNANIYIDGSATPTSVNFYNNAGTYMMLLPYSALGEANGKNPVNNHYVDIKAGTWIGGFLVSEDFCLTYHCNTVRAGHHETVSLNDIAEQDSNQRYWINLKLSDGYAPARDIYWNSNHVLINGDSTAVNYYFSSSNLPLLLPYNLFTDNAATAADVKGMNTVTIPAGTVVGDIVFDNTLTFKVGNAATDMIIGTQTRGNDTRLVMKLTATAEEIEAYQEVGFKLNIDGEESIIKLDSVYDSFYNDGQLVTAADIGCTYVAICEIGDIAAAKLAKAQGIITVDDVDTYGAVRMLK